MANKTCIVATFYLVFTLLIAQSTNAQERSSTRIQYLPVGEAQLPVIRVKVADEVYGNFVFDTGSDVSFVTDRMAARLNLTPAPFLGAVDGKPLLLNGRPLQQVNLTLHLGDFPIEGPVAVIQAAQLAFVPDMVIDGLIGTTTLNPLAVLLKFKQHEITLWYPGSLSEGDRERAGMKSAIVVNRSHGKPFAFHIPVQINERTSISMVVDTGADGTYIPYDLVKQWKLPTKDTGIIHDSLFGKITQYKASIDVLRVGAFEHRNWQIEFAPKAPVGLPPHIGLDILSQYSVLIDYPADKLYLMRIPSESSPASVQNPPATGEHKP